MAALGRVPHRYLFLMKWNFESRYFFTDQRIEREYQNDENILIHSLQILEILFNQALHVHQ